MAHPFALIRAVAALLAVLLVATACTGSDDQAAEPDDASDEIVDADGENTDGEDTDGDSSANSDGQPDASTGDPVTVIDEDFDGEPDPGWNRVEVIESPQGGQRLLGRAANNDVLLSLDGLGPHDTVTVAFDLIVGGSWDGVDTNDPTNDDIWSLRVDGQLVIATTFSNTGASQNYPGQRRTPPEPAQTGAVAVDELGFDGGEAVYRIERTLAHTADQIEVGFRGSRLDGDEWWGLDNVVVTVDASDAAAATLRVDAREGQHEVGASVGSEEEAVFVRGAVDDILGVGDAAEISVVEGMATPLWLLAVPGMLQRLSGRRMLSLEIDGATASLTGDLRSPGFADALVGDIEELVGPGVTVDAAITTSVAPDVEAEVNAARILFEVGSAAIDDAGAQTLDGLADLLGEDEALALDIIGFTDSTGTEATNRQLAGERAEAALDALVDRGVDPTRLRVVGSANRLEVEEETAEDRATNRRVRFWVRPD